jgi:hypothetical protein
VVGGHYRFGDTPLWFGARYALAQTSAALNAGGAGLPGVSTGDFDLRLGALTPSITLDMRDNFFTPTRGWYVDLSVPVFRGALGSDRDFEKAALTAMHFEPLASRRSSACAEPAGQLGRHTFFMRPYVALRGGRRCAIRAAGGGAGVRSCASSRIRASACGFGGAHARATLRDRLRAERHHGGCCSAISWRVPGLRGRDAAVRPTTW